MFDTLSGVLANFDLRKPQVTYKYEERKPSVSRKLSVYFLQQLYYNSYQLPLLHLNGSGTGIRADTGVLIILNPTRKERSYSDRRF
jgi:hypothetical protein